LRVNVSNPAQNHQPWSVIVGVVRDASETLLAYSDSLYRS